MKTKLLSSQLLIVGLELRTSLEEWSYVFIKPSAFTLTSVQTRPF